MTHHVVRYADGAQAANAELGIALDRTRRWTRDAILDGFRKWTGSHAATPGQIRRDHESGKIQLSLEDYRELGQLIDAAGRIVGGSRAACIEIGFTTPSRPRKKRRQKRPEAL